MIELLQHVKDDPIPDCDYFVDKVDKLDNLISVLTPKFSGNWVIVLFDPKLPFIEDFLSDKNKPEWIDFIILTGKKKLDIVLINHPEYSTKRLSTEERLNLIIKGMRHAIDENAKRYLLKALGSNVKEMTEVLTKLDAECNAVSIGLKDVKVLVKYQKRVYASQVMNAFLERSVDRWSLYDKLVHDLGIDHAYNACYSYTKKLLKEKEKYLVNEEVKLFVVSHIDAPSICFAYRLFINSCNSYQLIGILRAIDMRGTENISGVIVQ